MSADVFSGELLAALQELPQEQQRRLENMLRGVLDMDALPAPVQRPSLRLVVDRRQMQHEGVAP